MIQEQEAAKQHALIKKWINSKLAPRSIEVGDIQEDLKTGVVLYNLLEVLSGVSLGEVVGKLSQGSLSVHWLANVTLCLRYLDQLGMPRVNIGPDDIVNGKGLVLGLLWRIMLFFLARGGEKDADLGVLRHLSISWLRGVVQRGSVIGGELSGQCASITDVTMCLKDGRVLRAVLGTFPNRAPRPCIGTPGSELFNEVR